MLRLSVIYKRAEYNAVLNDEQEKESIIRVRMGSKNPYPVITVCHHSASLVMPNSDPRGIFFIPTSNSL